MSKFFFLGIVIVILIVGWYGIRHTTLVSRFAVPTKKSSNVIHKSVLSQKQIQAIEERTVQDFFSEFATCMKHPPFKVLANQASLYCQAHAQTASKNLTRNLMDEYSPVICGETFPASTSARTASLTTDTTATVLVTYYRNIGTQDVTYELQKENNIWKVNDVICPKS